MASNPSASRLSEDEYQTRSRAYAMGLQEHQPALTDEQVERLKHINARIDAISDELYGFQTEVEGWATWNEAAEWGELGVERQVNELALGLSSGTWDEIREVVRNLRVTRGLPGFSDFWESRILHLQAPKEFEEELCERHGGDDDRELVDIPDSQVPRRPRFIAVDKAVRSVDPELVQILDQVASAGQTAVDRRKALAEHGLTEEQLYERAAAVITQLIESGWRP